VNAVQEFVENIYRSYTNSAKN